MANIKRVLPDLTAAEKKQIRKTSDKPQPKSDSTSRQFSIDEYVKKAAWKKRDIHGVMVLSLPAFKVEITGHSS